MGNIKDRYFASMEAEVEKIDNAASDGLAGTVNSIGYKVAEIETHLHSAQQIYGLTANTMARKALTPIIITGGSDAWGTELELHNGTVIESGSATKYFDSNKIFVTAVGTPNRVTMLEFYNNALATAVTDVALTDEGDLFTKVGHGRTNGDKLMLSSIVDTTGINIYTVYYVVGVIDNDFQVSLTLGGGAVAITTNGTCSFQVVTPTLITEDVVSKTAVNSDAMEKAIPMERQLCNSRISCRAKAAGGVNAVSFFIGLHTYSSW